MRPAHTGQAEHSVEPPVPPENSVLVDSTALTFLVHSFPTVYRAAIGSAVKRDLEELAGSGVIATGEDGCYIRLTGP